MHGIHTAAVLVVFTSTAHHVSVAGKPCMFTTSGRTSKEFVHTLHIRFLVYGWPLANLFRSIFRSVSHCIPLVEKGQPIPSASQTAYMSEFPKTRRPGLLDAVFTAPLLGNLTIMGTWGGVTCMRSCEAAVGLCMELKLWVRLLGIVDVWCRGETGGFSDALRLRSVPRVAFEPRTTVESTGLSLLRTTDAAPP